MRIKMEALRIVQVIYAKDKAVLKNTVENTQCV